MRILLLSSSFTPLTGGAETYVRLLARGLAREGHDVVVVTDGSWLPDWPTSKMSEGVLVLRLSLFAQDLERKDTVRWRRMQYAVLDELAPSLPWKPDIVHANSHETLLLGSVIALDVGAALVASLHEQNPDLEAFGRGRCRVAYEVLPVDAYLAGSMFYYERAERYGAALKRLHLIYHGVEVQEQPTAELRAQGRARWAVAADIPFIVCPGRIYERKGQIDLVPAFADVRGEFGRARLLLAGRISDFEYATKVMDLLEHYGLQEAVDVVENLTGADMPETMAAADVIVQPSLEEGLGLAVIEAMSLGCPVVASDVVGLQEVVTHETDGLLVPSRNAPALAKAIRRLLREPALAARLGASARQTAEERFSHERMVQDTLDAYGAALRSRRGNRSCQGS